MVYTRQSVRMGHKVYIFPILLAGGNSRAIGIVGASRIHQQAHHQSPVLNYDSLELPARRMMGRLPDGVPEVDLVGLERPDVVLDQLAGAVLLEVVR